MPVPNVQWKTPDDGQRNCPKHVEFRSRINLEISASVGFIKKNFVTMHGRINVKMLHHVSVPSYHLQGAVRSCKLKL